MAKRHIPMDITEEILLNLPVKSLIRFRCVSRLWNSMIRGPSFVRRHLAISKSRPQLHIDHQSSPSDLGILISISNHHSIEDTTHLISPFDDQQSLRMTFLIACEEFWCCKIDNSLFIWNVSMRTYKKLSDPYRRPRDCCRFYGMGYDPVGDDYKVLKFSCSHEESAYKLTELYSLRNDAWRIIEPFPGEGDFIPFNGRGVLLNGVIHWMVYPDGRARCTFPSSIISFDLSTESYGEVPKPEDPVLLYHFDDGSLTVLNGMLCAYVTYQNKGLVLWVMKEYGVGESWTKMHDIEYASNPYLVLKIIHATYLRVLIPIYLSEDGLLILLIWGMMGAELVTYRDDKTTSKIIISADDYMLTCARLHAQSLISPCHWPPMEPPP